MCEGEYTNLKELLNNRENEPWKKVALGVLERIAIELIDVKASSENEALRRVMDMSSLGSEMTLSEDFQLLEEIGKGNFGQVWKAKWRGGYCAVKELLAPDDQEWTADAARMNKQRETFTKEIVQLQSMRHANIVQYYGCEVKGDSMYLLTEYVDGGSLSEWLQKQRAGAHRLEMKQALKMAEDVAVGINVMHCAGYVHCDIACRNVLKGDGVCKVADLGLAQRLKPNGSASISIYPMMWTAPEAVSDLEATVLSDVWMFGVLLWELFSYCMEKPYEQFCIGTATEYVRLLTSSSVELCQPRGCPDEIFDKLIKSCLALDPNQRISMHGILAKVRQISNDRLIADSVVPLPEDYVDHTGLITLTALHTGMKDRLLTASQVLDLSGLSIDDKEITHIVPSLLHMYHTSINLSGNDIGDNGCKVIAEGYASDSLHTIDLTRNSRITESGREALKSSSTCANIYKVSVSEYGQPKNVVNLRHAIKGICFDTSLSQRLVAWEDQSDHIQLWNVAGDMDNQELLELTALPYVRSASWDCKGNNLAASCAGVYKGTTRSCVMVWNPPYITSKPYIINSETDYVSHLFHPYIEDFIIVFTSGNSYTMYNVPFKQSIISITTPYLPHKSIPKFTKIFAPGFSGLPDLLVWGNKKIVIGFMPTDSLQGIFIEDHEKAKKLYGEPVIIQAPHRYEMTDLQIQPGNGLLNIATCGSDGGIYIWNQRGKKTHAFRGHTGGVFSLTWSVDGKTLFTAGERQITAWSVEREKKLCEFAMIHRGKITCIALDHVGQVLATCGRDSNMAFWHCTVESTIDSLKELPRTASTFSSNRAVCNDSSVGSISYAENYKHKESESRYRTDSA